MTSTARPTVRVRHVEVRAVDRPTPRTVRVTFGAAPGEDLEDLPAVAPDAYLKMFFPVPGELEPAVPDLPPGDDLTGWFRSYLAMPDHVRPPMRTYTLRRRHAEGFDVDFVIHERGPGRDWAQAAAPGDRVAFTGPYGLYAPGAEHDWQLLVGDETAVPALGAIVESLPAGARAVVVASVRDAAEHLTWPGTIDVGVTWVDGTEQDLVATVRGLELPPGRPYVWLAGEAGAVRDLRRHVVGDRGVAKGDICFTGYWRRGRTEEQEVLAVLDGEASSDGE